VIKPQLSDGRKTGRLFGMVIMVNWKLKWSRRELVEAGESDRMIRL
jgi:hypothetical protein